MVNIRTSASRGYAHHGWLESYHSFSFAGYYDPAHMGFSVLRVINDDKVAPANGFGMHGHQDMEIITYMLAGELRHEDSMGNGSVIRAGDVQRMTAGTGVRHSEMNASSQSTAHLLQIWIIPETNGLPPGYEEKNIPLTEKQNQWRLIASRDARNHSLLVHQDLSLYTTVLDAEKQLSLHVQPGRVAYVHVARGSVNVDGQSLQAGDALMIDASVNLKLEALAEAEILWFDLPGSLMN
ncbi:pirin family protein [Methylophilus aquaticus]|uniref:Pirin family protein n=1 Tax=Methylophilus aquaticus TaxID=1971610 RepID=A0ABT9JSW4_9PROT|nr:pirin family protein [Methylophilus aquaticus]MDP8567635.1 pirin family protein [Methylophilus aquaticus]